MQVIQRYTACVEGICILLKGNIFKYKILTASPSVNNKGRRKNAPAQESNSVLLCSRMFLLTIILSTLKYKVNLLCN